MNVTYLYEQELLDKVRFVAEQVGSGMTVVHHPDAPMVAVWPDWLNVRSSRYVKPGRVLLIDNETFDLLAERGAEEVRNG